jgi:hypothetical protein
MTYLLYVVVKLACYIGWCWFGLRLWRPGDATPFGAFRFGALRLVIGIIFGFFIFFGAGAMAGDDLLWDYVKIYTPVRLLEWFILAWLILRHSANKLSKTTWLWCLGGIIVSFAADLASPAGLEGHFCVGRCLC